MTFPNRPPPYAPGIARRLSRSQRNILINHVMGEQPFIVGPETATVQSLMTLKLLKGDKTLNPKNTSLSYLGREVVCVVLAEYAEALLRAGPDYEQRLFPHKFEEASCQRPSNPHAATVPTVNQARTATLPSDSASVVLPK